MNVREFNHSTRHIWHAVYVFSKILKDFHEYRLINVSNQLVVGIDFSCFWLKNYENEVLRYGMTIKQYFCVEESFE